MGDDAGTGSDQQLIMTVVLLSLSALVVVSTFLDVRMTRRLRKHPANRASLRRAALVGCLSFVCCHGAALVVLICIAAEEARRIVPWQFGVGVALLMALWIELKWRARDASSVDEPPSE